MEKKLHDWRDDFDLQEEEEIVSQLIEKSKVCYYCRNEVEADYGQTQVYCEHCQTISLAVKPT